jgi:flavin reductase (DIM6/NTAB) family NADH-FMN oxidoreductase RutF
MKIEVNSLNRSTKYSLLASSIVPRPIALISTVGETGITNVAPFSFFAPLCYDPPILCLSIGWRRSGQKKDTLRNIEFSRDFVVNIVDENLAQAMNEASFDFPPDVSEFQEARLTALKGDMVSAPIVAESPISMECKVVDILFFGRPESGSSAVLGEVLKIHLRDDLWADGQIDPSRLKAVGRLGADFYCRTKDLFEMKRPSSPARGRMREHP